MKSGIRPRARAVAESLALVAAVACLVAATFLEPLWSILLGTSLVLIALGLPSAISLLLGARPLEAGALDRRLRETRPEPGASSRDLRVWDGPRSSRAGALAAGLLPGARSFFLSRSLLERVDEDAAAAVFAHELAHLERHHPGIILLAVLASVLPLEAIRSALEPAGAPWAWGATALYGGIALLGIVPRLSRELELEADLHAAEAVGKGPYLALLGSETARGELPGGLRHPPGEERARALEAASSTEGKESARRRGRLLRLAVMGWFVVVAGFAVGSWVMREIV